MNLNVSGHHMEVTDALRDYVDTKMARIERHFDHVIDAEIVLEVAKERHSAEATMQLSGTRLHAEATEPDMYAAIDSMVDKLDRQTRRHKEKARDHHGRDGRRQDRETG